MITSKAFIGALQIKLENHRPRITGDWRIGGYRTSIFTGAAVKKMKDIEHGRDKALLTEVFKEFNYQRYNKGCRNDTRYYIEYEMYKKDLIAINCLSKPWGIATWLGEYEIDMVCEVENNISEFKMTVRGMFDIRSQAYAGIFFAENDDPDICAGKSKGDEGPCKFTQWVPMTEYGNERLPEKTELAIIIVSSINPAEINRVKTWKIQKGNWVETET
jgi:hypothetical protein